MKPHYQRKEKEFDEKVIKINRITRVVKGGRRLRFRATVIAGDRKGRIGIGVAKANEVSDAVQKAATKAKENLITVPIIKNTIPHETNAKYGTAKILLKPASEGTGVIAGGAVRDILDICGIKNIVSKNHGSRNKINSSKATIEALKTLRTKEAVFGGRGMNKQAKKPVNKDEAVKKDTPKVKTDKPVQDKTKKTEKKEDKKPVKKDSK